MVENSAATIQDWKSGWVAESEESLETAWAPGLYAGLLWAAAPRLEAISVEYHYLRTVLRDLRKGGNLDRLPSAL
jgi:hypothetical protein